MQKDRSEFLIAPRPGLCLDFANTLAYRGSTPSESLHTFADLLKWRTEAGSLPAPLGHQLEAWQEKHPRRVAEIFNEAITIREAIYRVFHSIAGSDTPAEADLEIVNRGLRGAPLRNAIARDGDSFRWLVEEMRASTGSFLAPVLWSVGDLLVGPQLEKLRECSNEKCLWLFLDDSKNGTRRWCSMQSCGNRAKAQRHYLRHKHVNSAST